MKVLFLFFALAYGWFNPFCSFSREDAIKCFAEYIDTNKDGVISIEELDHLRSKYDAKGSMMSWFEWAAGKGGIDTSTATLIRDCDENKDGRFTPDDFRKSTKTCLPSRWSLCLVKVMCDAEEKDAKDAAFKAYMDIKLH